MRRDAAPRGAHERVGDAAPRDVVVVDVGLEMDLVARRVDTPPRARENIRGRSRASVSRLPSDELAS